MATCTKLFVYGSLLTGSGRPPIDRLLAARGRDLGAAVMRGRLYQLGGYPGALPSWRRRDAVFGRLIRVRDVARVLRLLDEYEAYFADRPARSEFVRARIVVTLLPARRRMAAWAYLYNGRLRGKRRIAGGDYAAFLRGPCRGEGPHDRNGAASRCSRYMAGAAPSAGK